MLPSWCTDVATVLRAPTVVRSGRASPDWRNAVPHTVAGCSLQGSSTETDFDGAQRNASASAATLLCPPGADVAEGDRVKCGGHTWEVDGVPFEVRSPTGRTSHLRVRLREWRG
ncbi:MAG: hypothetical protein IJ092_00855 [Atopobiaceae bacterium]|nr:hypothetical protein [Atopobiaceae bacterium]